LDLDFFGFTPFLHVEIEKGKKNPGEKRWEYKKGEKGWEKGREKGQP
jgi:hypothetical protein